MIAWRSKDKTSLLDLYSSLELALENAPESGSAGVMTGYEEYKPLPELETGIKSGKFFQGTGDLELHIHRFQEN